MLTKKDTSSRTCYCQNHKRTRIIKDYRNYNDTKTWENSNGLFILPTNQLTTDKFKSTRKAYTQRNQ